MTATTTATAAPPIAAARVDHENSKVATLPKPKPSLLAGNAGHAIVPQSVEACFRMAELIHKAGMAPKSLNSVEKCCVAIMHGLEVGLTPMAALQSIAVINGNPSVWGDGMLALIEASGLMEDFEETIDYNEQGEPQSATCMMKRVGRRPTIRMFTRPMAARAGLLKKDGPWQGYPHRMMQRRARWWCATDTFADVLKGLSSAEERQDMVDITEQASATVAEPTRKDFSGAEPREAEAPTWELFDDVGEMVGEFAVVEWTNRLVEACKSLQGKPREQMIENNRDTAKAVWESDQTTDATAADIKALYTPAAPAEVNKTTEQRGWGLPEGIVGQDNRKNAILKMLDDETSTVEEVDALQAEHAEFIGKLGRLKAEVEKRFNDRRMMLRG